MKLENKVAIITGGSRGIGYAIASRFAREGASLVLGSRTIAELEMVKQEIEHFNPSIEIMTVDVSQEDDISSLVDFTIDRFGTVDILVNSAGIYGPIGHITEIDAQKWIEAININLIGTFLAMKVVLPVMIEKKKGKIVNLSGGGAVSPFPRFSAYSASKAAVVRLTETISQEVRQYNIDINAIAPGAVNTRLLDQVLEAGEAAGEEFLKKANKQKEEGGVSPEDVAGLALFLGSSESDGLSGKLISLLWDNWRDIPSRVKEVMDSDVYAMRRIIPEDRGFDW